MRMNWIVEWKGQKVTVDLLYALSVVVRKLEVIRLHPLVEGSHDGQGVTGVLQAQGVAQLMDRHQEQVITWINTELISKQAVTRS